MGIGWESRWESHGNMGIGLGFPERRTQVAARRHIGWPVWMKRRTTSANSAGAVAGNIVSPDGSASCTGFKYLMARSRRPVPGER